MREPTVRQRDLRSEARARQLYEIADWICKHTSDSGWTHARALEVDGAMRHLNAEWSAAKLSFAMKPEWFTYPPEG